MREMGTPEKDFDDFVRWHEEFALNILQERGKFTPQVSYCKDKKLIIVMCIGREAVRLALIKAKSEHPDWIVNMSEGYRMSVPKEKKDEFFKKFQHGDLEKRFLAGDKSIKESITIVVYMKNKSKVFSYDIVRGECGRAVKLEKMEDIKEFGGYLV